MTVRRWALAVAITLGLVAITTGPTEVAAQVENGGALSLTGQTTFVRPRGFFDLELRVAGVGVRHTITVEVYPPVESRSEFLDGLRPGADLGEPAHVVDAGPIDDLQPANTDLISVRIRTSDPDEPRPDTATVTAGVHPVRVVLARPDGSPVDEVITHLVVLPPDTGDIEQLSVALLVPVDAPVALQPDREIVVDPASRAIIDNWVETLLVHDDTPVTFRIPGETVEALFRSGTDDNTATLEGLQSVADGRTFTAETYVDIDSEAWRDTRVDGYRRELSEADRAALAEHLAPATIDTTTHRVTETDTGETLLWLQQQGLDRVIVTDERLQPLDPDAFPLTLTQPFVLEHADGGVDALAVDAVLSSHFGATGSPVLDAHRMLADLTLLSFDDTATPRSALIAPPGDLLADPLMLTTLLTGIERSPLLVSATIDDAFAGPPANAGGNGAAAEVTSFPLVRRLTEAEEAPSLGAFPAQLIAAQQDLTSFETVVGADGPLSAPLRDLLLVSGAAPFDSDERTAYLDAVRTDLDLATGAISTESEQSVSLTARQADVPISLINELGVRARVQLVLESDKLDFPDGARLEMVLDPGTSTVEIPVRARTSGDAVLEITPRSPDDRLRLGDSTQVTVRSTVLSGLGIVISVIALAVLVTWWARQVWRRRRSNAA